MAETQEFSSLKLGIQDTEVLGNIGAVESFLSGSEEIKEIKSEEKEEVIVEKTDIDPFAEEISEEDEEKQEEEKKEETKEEEEENKEENNDSEISYSALAKDLTRLGIFTEMEDERPIESAEDFLERFQAEKQMGAATWLENFLSKHGEDRKEMFQAIFVNGVDPKEYLPTFNEIEDLSGLDINQEESQKYVFREYHKRLGWTSDQIEKRLNKVIDYGDLQDEASLLHGKLIEDNKKKLEDISKQAEQRELTNKKLEQDYKSSVNKVLTEALQKREFKGMPVNENRANEVADFLYTPKYKTPDGKVLTEFDKFVLESKKPENIEQRILIAMLKLENFDFSKIEKKAISKQSNNIFSELAQKTVKSKTRDISNLEKNKGSSWANKL